TSFSRDWSSDVCSSDLVLRLAVGLIFAIPAAIAGYALVHGIAREAIPSDIWRQIFSLAAGACAGLSAVVKLGEPAIFGARLNAKVGRAACRGKAVLTGF